jgi:hypothetical protein
MGIKDQFKDQFKDKANELKGQAQKAMGGAREEASERAQQAQERAQQGREQTEDAAEDAQTASRADVRTACQGRPVQRWRSWPLSQPGTANPAPPTYSPDEVHWQGSRNDRVRWQNALKGWQRSCSAMATRVGGA